MRQRITKIVIKFAIAIACVLAFGIAFSAYADTLPADRQDDVLIKALPFVARFVAILLAYICVIVIAAVVLNGRIPRRVHRPIEIVIILGILLGVVGLFQPWQELSYQYGFSLLLISTLAFTLWSHVIPDAPSEDLPVIDMKAHIIGLVAGLLIVVPLALAIIDTAKPAPPYDLNPTVWARLYEGKEKGADLKDEKEASYREMLPVFIFISGMAGAIGYVVVREVAAQTLARQFTRVPAIPQPESST